MKVIVEKNKASLREWQGKVLTSGTVGEMLRFEFSPEWDGLVKTAVFRNGIDNLPDKTIRSDNTVEIPAEALARAGLNLRVGVYGENLEGNLVIPTVYASLGVISQGAAKTHRPAHPPSPDWTARVDKQLQETIEIAEEMQRKADAGEFNGAGLDIKGARPGQVAVVKTVDGNGKPIEWEPKTMEGSGGGVDFTTDKTLTLDNGVLKVNTASTVEADNTLPITSAAVFVEVGNIDALLQTI